MAASDNWHDIFGLQGNSGVKCPCLVTIVKCMLVVTHGNSDSECGFSQSGYSVTAERVRLTEVSANGLSSVADGLRLFDSQPHRVPITKEFLALGRSAHI